MAFSDQEGREYRVGAGGVVVESVKVRRPARRFDYAVLPVDHSVASVALDAQASTTWVSCVLTTGRAARRSLRPPCPAGRES